jgi:protein-disulfide isomerase
MTSIRRASLVLCPLLAWAHLAWGLDDRAASAWQPGATSAEGTPVLADVDGEPITEAEVAKAAGPAYNRLLEELYSMKRLSVQRLIDERLLAREAARRGVSVPALVEAEVAAKATVSREEAEAYVEAHAGEFRVADPLETRIEQGRTRLVTPRLRARRLEFLAELRSHARVTEYLVAPEPYRAPISEDGERVRGAAAAPVTIVEFSDFHCPFCRRVQPVLEQVLARYGDKVRLVYRDFPLDLAHPQARRAAEAARCAGEQGRFWEFHDSLYRSDPDASDAALGRIAAEAKLDAAALLACVASGRQAAAVRADSDAGHALSINSTPSFFVNGRPFNGSQSIESFSKLIDDELGRSGKKSEAAGR